MLCPKPPLGELNCLESDINSKVNMPVLNVSLQKLEPLVCEVFLSIQTLTNNIEGRKASGTCQSR